MTFMDHLVELRSRVVKSVLAVGVGTIIALFGWRQILDILAQPYFEAVDGDRLNFFQVTEAFSLALRIGLFGGLLLASPVVIYQLWQFVAPALTERERKYVAPLSAVLSLLFVGGVASGYLALPLTLDLLLGFGDELLQPTIGADFYLRFAMRFLFAFGVAFLFPVFLFAAAAIGVLGTAQLRHWRPWAVTVIIVVAAFLTPGGDPLTLMLLTGPMYILYEVTILAIRFILKR
jgi:sec-independent protein translocase protein TatC